MFSFRPRLIRLRIIVDYVHVAHQADTRMLALNQIVAEQRIFRETPFKRPMERAQIVDALARIAAASVQVLISVRHRPGVRIEARLAAVNFREPRPPRRFHADADARLEKPVSFSDNSRLWIEDWLVQRMGQRADQLPSSISRKLRIAIKRDHETD